MSKYEIQSKYKTMFDIAERDFEWHEHQLKVTKDGDYRVAWEQWSWFYLFLIAAKMEY